MMMTAAASTAATVQRRNNSTMIVLFLCALMGTMMTPVQGRVGSSSSSSRRSLDTIDHTSSSSSYPLQSRQILQRGPGSRQRRKAQTNALSLAQLQSSQLLLSWSEDSAPKSMANSYYFGLYETKGDLPRAAIDVVERGMASFIATQLNEHYANSDEPWMVVDTVQVSVVTQSASATSSRRQLLLRSLQDDGGSSSTTTGSQLETHMLVTFQNEPSPKVEDVENILNTVLSSGDLSDGMLAQIKTALSSASVSSSSQTSVRQTTNSDATAAASSALSKLSAIYYLGNNAVSAAGGQGSGGDVLPPPTQEETVGGDGGAGTTDGSGAATGSSGSDNTTPGSGEPTGNEGDVPIASVTKGSPQAAPKRSLSNWWPWEWVIPLFVALFVVMACLALFIARQRRGREGGSSEQNQRAASGAGSSIEEDLMADSATNGLFSSPYTVSTTSTNTRHKGDSDAAIILPHQADGVNLLWDSADAEDDFNIETALMENSAIVADMNATESNDTAATGPTMSPDTDGNRPLVGTPKRASKNSSHNNSTTLDDQSDIFSGIGGGGGLGSPGSGNTGMVVGGVGSYPQPTNTTLSSPREGSGVGTPMGYSSESPRNGDSRSVFSFLSGFASKASTVVASNVTTPTTATGGNHKGLLIGTAAAATGTVAGATAAVTGGSDGSGTPTGVKSPYGGGAAGTPHSRVSSLFTFSEEDSDDLNSGDERVGTSPRSGSTSRRRAAAAAAAASHSLLDSTAVPGGGGVEGGGASTTRILGTVPSDEDDNIDDIDAAPSDEQGTGARGVATAAAATAATAATVSAAAIASTKGVDTAVVTKPSKGKSMMSKVVSAVAPWVKHQRDANGTHSMEAARGLDASTTVEDEALKIVEQQTAKEEEARAAIAAAAAANESNNTDDNGPTSSNVSHVFDTDGGTDTSASKSMLDSPNASLNDSMFAAAAGAVPTLTIDDASDDANHSWCKDSCAFTETERATSTTAASAAVGVTAVSAAATASSAVVALKDVYAPSTTAAEDNTKESDVPAAAKLSADEIAQELKEAEAESKKLKKMSTNWNMGFFGPTLVESPAAASYSNAKRSTSLPSPASSRHSHMSDPGPNVPNSPTTLIELQWDDPNQAAANRAKAAAFAGSMAEQTKSTTTSNTTSNSSAERFRMLTKDAKSRRMSTKSAGNADGTDIYQNDAAEQGSVGSSSKGSLSFRRGRGKPMSKAAMEQLAGRGSGRADDDDDADPKSAAAAGVLATLSIDSPTGLDRVRRHAKNTAEDGTTNYQHETMGDWSVDGDEREDPSVTDSADNKDRKRRLKLDLKNLKTASAATASKKPPKSPSAGVTAAAAAGKTPRDANTTSHTPRSAVTNSSSISGLSVNSPANNSEASPSKQLISDLLWLEQKIAATNNSSGGGGASTPKSLSNVGATSATRGASPSDSLSFASGDQGGDSSRERSSDTRADDSAATATLHQSIVCRDCYAPPGKLKIVIHSTKDGPAVHTVKKGSSLEGHIFAGDLIISVDNVDTRSYSAEQVMKMMTAKTRFERKITVLHFEVTNENNPSGVDISS